MAGLSIKALIAGSRDLQQPVELFRGEVIVKEVNRVEAGAVLMYFIVTVRGGALTGISNPPDDLSAFYPLSALYLDAEHMPVKGFIPIAMVYNYVIAIPIS